MNHFWNILTAHGDSEFFALLASAGLKSTVLLAFVALICLSIRRFSAASRHRLWTFAICGSLLLPWLSFLTIWEVPILPATELILIDSGSNSSAGKASLLVMPEAEFSERSGVWENSEIQTKAVFSKENSLIPNTSNGLEISSPEDSSFFAPRMMDGILAVWLAGVLLLLFRLAIGFSATNLLARRAMEIKDAANNELFSALLTELNLKGRVRLLRSENTQMPIVCGVLRPAVLLPASADEWSEKRLKLVLLHELTHVARRDCLTQILAQTACAVYWFNPLVWYAARRLRVEREQACDDRVLSVGAKPSEYAGHLLEIARSMQNRSVFEWSKATTVAMARKSQFEGRLLAILSVKSEKCLMSRASNVGVAALICVLFVSLTLIRPAASSANIPLISEFDTISHTNSPPESLPDSLLTTDFKTLEEKGTLKEKTRDSVEKENPEIAAVSNETVLKHPKNPAQNETDDEIVLQSNEAQNVAPQTFSSAPQDTNAQTDSKTNQFVNAKYNSEENSGKQNKSRDFIDEMASVGLTNLSVDELITLKTYGVTADFVRGLRALGFNSLTPKTLTSLRIYKVTPAYVEAMAAAGYKGLTLKELTSARIYSVTPEYVKAIQNAGYPALSIGQMIQFKIYSITPELVRSARSRLGDLTPKQMISLKNSGILSKVEEKKKDRE